MMNEDFDLFVIKTLIDNMLKNGVISKETYNEYMKLLIQKATFDASKLLIANNLTL